MTRWIPFLLLVICLAVGTWWLSHHNDQIRDLFQQNSESEIIAFEAKAYPKEIFSEKDLSLSANPIKAKLRFYPYLLMNVRASSWNKMGHDEQLLWGLYDGEIVIHTKNWERTHGLADCIDANACREDFRIITTLFRTGGSLSHDELARKLHIDSDLLDSWVSQARNKHLIFMKGDRYYLNFQDPKLNVYPKSELSESLNKKSYLHVDTVNKRFSKEQIEKTAKSLFGNDFQITTSQEVYLPVYLIETQDFDGSIQTTYWNALNGQPFRLR